MAKTKGFRTCVLNVGIIRKLMICYWCRVSLQAAPRFGKLFSKYMAFSAHQWSSSLRHHILNDLCLRFFFTYRGTSWGNVDAEIANCGLGHNVVIMLLQTGNYPQTNAQFIYQFTMHGLNSMKWVSPQSLPCVDSFLCLAHWYTNHQVGT